MSNESAELKAQVAQERGEIEAAPKVLPRPMVGRCGVCGRPARNLTRYSIVGGVERFKGECCSWA